MDGIREGSVADLEPKKFPDKDGVWPSKVIRKMEKINRVTIKVQEHFNIPTGELFLMDYGCTFYKEGTTFIKNWGRLYVTSNRLCFASSLPKIEEIITYNNIEEIGLESGKTRRRNQLAIKTKTGEKISFCSLGHPLETLALVQHQLVYPVSFVVLTDDDGAGLQPSFSDVHPQQKSKFSFFGGSKSSDVLPKGGEREEGIGGEELGGGEVEGKKKKSLYVNVEGSEKGVGLANEARDKGIEILEELESQGERLDKIEAYADQIDHNLKRGQRMLSGIESASGAAKNLMTLNPHKNPEKVIALENAAHKKWQGMSGVVSKVPVLLKQKRTNLLVPCLLCFEREEMYLFLTEKNAKVSNFTIQYTDISDLIVRNRALHVDVFHHRGQRMRLVSSHLQSIVNEIFLRGCDKRETGILVWFEPGTQLFDYGSYSLALDMSRGVERGEEGERCFGGRKKISIADLLSDEVDDETKSKVREVEANMVQIDEAALELEEIAKMMDQVLGQQTEQIERIAEKTHQNNDALHEQNKRLTKLNGTL